MMTLESKMPRMFLATALGLVLMGGHLPEAAAQPQKPTPAKPGTPDGAKLMTSVEDRPDGKDMTADVTLEIQPKTGSKRIRQFSLLRKEFTGMTKLVTKFISPADVRDAAFLVWDEHNKADRRWLYLPAIGQVRRLASSEDRTSFFGSDFVYEDLTNRDPDLDTHTFVASQKVPGPGGVQWDCWVVDSVPKDAKKVDFVKYRSWIWKDDPLLMRQEYQDAAGKVIRRGELRSIKKIQGIWTWHQGTMHNLKTGSKTLLEMKNVKYDTGVADERFTETQLSRNAP